jgi:predicted O-methyltransferase YrrM
LIRSIALVIDLQRTLTQAQSLFDNYQQCIADIKRPPRGVSYGDMLFAYATIQGLNPPKIVESGRAQGQSTLILSRCFPQTPIISVECDPDQPDEAIALKRLQDHKNVDCRYGDARNVLPQIVSEMDVVLIDGPKIFRALKLVYKLLKNNHPSVIFLHDCVPGTAFRSYIEEHIPWTFFADDPEFLDQYKHLDKDQPLPQPSLGCIAPRPNFPGFKDLLSIQVTRRLDILRTRKSR